jgi:hypothetical protein
MSHRNRDSPICAYFAQNVTNFFVNIFSLDFGDKKDLLYFVEKVLVEWL